MEGWKIREYLLRLKQVDRNITQRWLVKQLRKRGFSTLWEPRFTNILDGMKSADSDAVLETSLDILQKEAEKLNLNLN